MSPLILGIIMVVVLVVLIVLKFPIGFAFLLVGFLGSTALIGFDSAFALLASRIFSGTALYILTVVPVFVLMGEFALASGIGEDLFKAGRVWLGPFRGGLVMATTMANAVFGAACGMPAAATAVFGRIAIPDMLQAKTNRALAAGTVAATAGLSAVIPPSVIVIIYGFLAIAPIHKLLIAALIPGVLTTIVILGMLAIRVRINPSLAPASAVTVTWRERFRSLRGVWAMLAVIVLVIGGIFTGEFTPTEAGSVGAVGTLIIGLALRRFNWTKIKDALLMTARTSCIIFIVMGGISFFAAFLGVSGVSEALSNFILGLPVAPIWVVIGTMFIFLGLGCVLDPFSVLFLAVPLLAPIIVALGIDPIWYGVLVVKMATIGMFTPPVGVNCYMLKIVCPELDLWEIFRGTNWFLLAEAVVMALLIAFPLISLWLPGIMW
jgi:tripartite ATP-independent transporter DctM subunit